MKSLMRCERCGSAGSIEFDMCQVCYHDYSQTREGIIDEALQVLYRDGGGGPGMDVQARRASRPAAGELAGRVLVG